ncbi:MAG: CHAD domain-containing protein [Chlorobi bacterium]|nr:CHAD domain-containing protein [Chlorobiota bacterium]
MDPEPKTICFRLQENVSLATLSESPAFPVQLQLEFRKKENRVFYDTFEWRFFQHGLAIARKRKQLSLYDLENGVETASMPFPSAPAHFLPSSLSPGPARTLLEKITKIRALLRRCRIHTESVSWRMLDREEKTIGFLVSETCFLLRDGKRAPISGILLLTPLKGFLEETSRVARHLEKVLGSQSIFEFREHFTLLMHAAGEPVNSYSSRIRLSLRPTDPIRISAARLLLATLDVMRSNERWIPRDIDTEFLHDFRVAIRRTRSLLGQIKGVLSPDSTRAYRNAFREAGKKCNTLRDCDVYLLKENTYRTMLPGSLSSHIDTFFNDLQATRSAELRSFSAFLRSASFRTMLADWEALLSETINRQESPDETDAGELPTLAVARKAIGKAWEKVLRHGRSIPQEASDSELHALRIDCKKLRYLLEFFASLFPDKTVGQAIRHLKELQENLGTFVDLAVQQRHLLGYIESMKNRPSDPELAAALGGLVAELYTRQEKARRTFGHTFRRFDDDETETLFTEIINR